MKFVKLPKNGASWDGALSYTIATSDGMTGDAVVEVVDAISGATLGTRRLYGISRAEFDVAPYVRNAIGEATPLSATLSRSPSARKIIVRANGVESEERLFFRATLDTSAPQILSATKQSSVVAHGAKICLTVFAQEEVRLTIVDRRATTSETYSAIATSGMPVDIAVATSFYAGDNIPLTLKIVCDRKQTYTLDYTIVEPTSSSYSIAWYNTQGGIESYTFPRAVRESIGAELMSAVRGRAPRLRGVVARYRLLSAFERQEEVERLVGVIFSPEVFEVGDEGCSRVVLENRTISFDDHGGLRRVELCVKKEWSRGL